MRFLLYLLILSPVPVTFLPLIYLFLLGVVGLAFLTWDLWESFLAPRPAIVVTKPAAPSIPLMPERGMPSPGDRMTELLASRQKCAAENNCEECKKFIAQFEGGGMAITSPEPTKACYEPKGYL